jgi:hypothetical protein
VAVKIPSLEDISPDHTELLVCRDLENNRGPRELWVAPVLGGPPRLLGGLSSRYPAQVGKELAGFQIITKKLEAAVVRERDRVSSLHGHLITR